MAKKITIEDLAVMVKRGFGGVDKRFDAMATKDELNDLKGVVKDMVEELNTTHADVRYIRSTVGKLVQSDSAQDATIQGLTVRVHRLEQKAGLAK